MMITHHIIQCPQCQGLQKKIEVISGNTFGSSLWSDGILIAQMYPDVPKLSKCMHCQYLFWVRETHNLGEWLGDCPPAWSEAPMGSLYLVLEDWQASIEGKCYQNQEEEIYLRLQYWHTYNDFFRGKNKDNTEDILLNKPINEQNLMTLQQILQPNTWEEKLQQAEIARHLAQFEACIQYCKALEKDLPKGHYLHTISRKIRKKAQQQDTSIFEI